MRFAFLALSQAKVKGRKIGTWLVSISNILTTVLILRRLIQDQTILYVYSWKIEGQAGVFVSPHKLRFNILLAGNMVLCSFLWIWSMS